MNRYICRVCGYVHEGELDEKTVCPVCHLGAEFFKLETKPERDEHVFVDIDESNVAICRNPDKCVRCGNCKSVCRYKQAVYGRYNAQKCKGKSVCVDCGQCSIACPAEAIEYKNDYLQLKNEMKDKSKVFVFITAPATRVSLAEVFGQPEGTICTQHVVGALRSLGADYVFDATFGADLTIMEEAKELVSRLQSGKKLPMFTSCCPSWMKYAEIFYPKMLKNLSTCKSPLSMQAEVIKTYWAQKQGIEPERIRVVAITPCTAKKAEAKERKSFDYAVPVRELAKWMVEDGVVFNDIAPSEFDSVVGSGSGAGVIFGSAGGVMEAVLRTAYYFVTGKNAEQLNFKNIRSLSGYAEAQISIGGYNLKVAAVSGLANAKKLLDEIQKGKHFDFVEVMACLGGCIAGGGQPRNINHTYEEVRKWRSTALYYLDQCQEVRCAHDNPEIKTLYRDFLSKPGATQMLHTKFVDKSGILG